MHVPSAVRISLAALALSTGVLVPPAVQAQWGLSINVGVARTAPPPLPEYDQPVAPGDGYIWTPGYWAWDDEVGDYYWVDGEWVMAPQPGLLWTPGYWAYDNGAYRWNAGYWAEHVGFYGGVNYGFGYFGSGYDGGYWNGNRFYYNTVVNRIDTRYIRNTYQRDGNWNRGGMRIAFNGGPGGINMRPSRGEQNAFREQHWQPTMNQQRAWDTARRERETRGGMSWNGNRNGLEDRRNGRNADRDNRWNGGDPGGWNGDRNGWNGNRGNGGTQQPPVTGQPGNSNGWGGNRGNGGTQQPPVTGQPGNGNGNGWGGNRSNGGTQQPPVTGQPGNGNGWGGNRGRDFTPGDGSNRPGTFPMRGRDFDRGTPGGQQAPGAGQPPATSVEGRGNWGNGAQQAPANGGGSWNRGGNQGGPPPAQPTQPQGGARFSGGDRPAIPQTPRGDQGGMRRF